MSKFGDALKGLLEVRGISLREFERDTEIDHTTLSRLVKDQRPSREQLQKFLAYCRDERERFHLLQAHLQDEIEAFGLPAEKVALRYRPSGEWEFAALPAELRINLEILVPAALRTPALAAMLKDLATLVQDHEAKVYPFPNDRTRHVAESGREFDTKMQRALEKARELPPGPDTP